MDNINKNIPLFIMTRFCIGVTKQDYLEHRLTLFEHITLPSVLNQSDQYFRWLIVYDVAHPKKISRQLEKLIADYPHIDLVPFDPTQLRYSQIGNLEWVGQACIKHILYHNYIDDIAQYVLWGIIDDDDAWAFFVTSMVRQKLDELMHHDDMVNIADYYAHQTNSFCSHSLGATFTFDKGYSWLVNRSALINHEKAYLGMSCFLFTRFSSGLNALSCCHMNFESYFSHVNYGHFVIGNNVPAWIYTRHVQSMSPYMKHIGQEGMVDLSQDKPRRQTQKIFGVDVEAVVHYHNDPKTSRYYDTSQPADEGYAYRNLLPYYNRMHGHLQIMATMNQRIDALNEALTHYQQQKNKAKISEYKKILQVAKQDYNAEIKRFRRFSNDIKLVNFNSKFAHLQCEPRDPWL